MYENFDLLLLFTIIISNSNAYFWLKGNFMPTNTNATMWRDWCWVDVGAVQLSCNIKVKALMVLRRFSPRILNCSGKFVS